MPHCYWPSAWAVPPRPTALPPPTRSTLVDLLSWSTTHSRAEAVALKDGKILAVGTRVDLEKNNKTATTQMIDLGGKTLIPGFVDAHSHFSLIGLQAISANLLPAPDGPVNSIPALQQTLRDFMATSPTVKAHQVVNGMNYNDSQLAEHRHLTRQELDAVSTDVPVFVIHQSGHIGVYNSKALAMIGITAKTPNPRAA